MDAHRQLKETAQRRATIERERDEFRRRGYDNPYGSFGNEACSATCSGGVLTGAIGGAILGQVLRGGFHRGPSPWDSGFGGGLPFPPPDGFGDRRILRRRRRFQDRRIVLSGKDGLERDVAAAAWLPVSRIDEQGRAASCRLLPIAAAPDQGRRTARRRPEISFSQGAAWNALMSRYIGTIPLSGDACAAEQSISAAPRRERPSAAP